MSGTVDYGVLIGRFQPFHNGHLHLVREALDSSGKLLILVGSSNRPRLQRNPFTYAERKTMIEEAVQEELGTPALARIQIEPLPDRLYDHTAWLQEVQHVLLRHTDDAIAPSTGLFGHHRDATSFYLDDFPAWRNMVAAEAGASGVQATHIRKAFFRPASDGDIRAEIATMAPASVVERLWRFRGDAGFTQLMTDIEANTAYKRDWGEGPHTTGDSVVICAGHVLLIRRKFAPLQGTWALPGGFLSKPSDKENGAETLYQCATRELAEETNISLLGHHYMMPQTAKAATSDLLLKAYKGRDVFDDPHRSERARIITTAHLFDLGAGRLPVVKAADDAAWAQWVPLTQVRAKEMFDDHAFIIARMLKMLDRGMVH